MRRAGIIVQFGGGISTAVALKSNSKSVTVAEGNPAVLGAFRNDKVLRDFTGDVLHNPKIKVIDYEGRLYLANTKDRFDIIDLSLADSAGLSNPGGFAIVEKFAYSREAMTSYMRALKDGGILSVTLWNKEEPPKSVLKLYATMAEAARQIDGGAITDRFFVTSSYLSTATVLYKRGGFTPAETTKLREHTRAMSFDEIYYPGFVYDSKDTASVLTDYKNSIFPDAPTEDPALPANGAKAPEGPPADNAPLPATTMGQMAWHHLVHGGWDDIARRYVFDTRLLTNDRPYFAAYVKPADLPRASDRLELLQDEWGFLLVWATLGIACIAALSLVISAKGEHFLADTQVTQHPSSEDIAAMAVLAAAHVRRFGLEPKIALLSHSDFGSYESESARRMRRASELLAANHPELEADGEMNAESALNPEYRARVLPHSRLKGEANVLILPDLDAANIAYHAIQAFADALPVGPILMGAAHPAHILTPSVTPRGIVNMTAIAVVEAQACPA